MKPSIDERLSQKCTCSVEMLKRPLLQAADFSVGPLASVLPHICNTTVVGTWSWSTSPSFPAWGWRQLFSGMGGRRRKQPRMLERKQQLETITNHSSPEQLQCAFCPGSPPWKCLSWNCYLRRDRRKSFNARGMTESQLADWNSAIICIFIWCCRGRGTFSMDFKTNHTDAPYTNKMLIYLLYIKSGAS